jgi:amino acid transporter
VASIRNDAAFAANVFLVFFQGYTAFLNPFNATDFVQNYILLPVFVLFVLVYKFWKKTKYVKLEEMDIWSGRREYSDDEVALKHKGWLQRVKDVVVG